MMTAFIIIAIITVLALIVTLIADYCGDDDVVICTTPTAIVGTIASVVCGI